jgi:hypothetical protein
MAKSTFINTVTNKDEHRKNYQEKCAMNAYCLSDNRTRNQVITLTNRVHCEKNRAEKICRNGKHREGVARKDAHRKRAIRISVAGDATGVQKGNRDMSALLMEPNYQETNYQAEREALRTNATNAQAREAALERLVSLLEAGTSEYAHAHAHNTLESGVELSQLARLRAAHASYALSTSDKMRRVSEGAWVRATRA